TAVEGRPRRGAHRRPISPCQEGRSRQRRAGMAYARRPQPSTVPDAVIATIIWAVQRLVVDLTAPVIKTADEFWDALVRPLGLPTWFGRNLNAWDDTLWGGISDVVDQAEEIVIRVRAEGLFAPDDEGGRPFGEVTNWPRTAHIEVIQSADDQ